MIHFRLIIFKLLLRRLVIVLWLCGAGELELEFKSRSCSSCSSNTIRKNISTISPISHNIWPVLIKPASFLEHYILRTIVSVAVLVLDIL